MRGFVVLAPGALALCAAALVLTVQAQDLKTQFLPPLEPRPVPFEPEPKESIGLFTNIANLTSKPAGPSPFPQSS